MMEPSLGFTDSAPNCMPSGTMPCMPFWEGLMVENIRSCFDLSMVVTIL